ncbi:MAG: hypothetical protein NVS2B11_04780 [Acetobacteraceae bacterium]
MGVREPGGRGAAAGRYHLQKLDSVQRDAHAAADFAAAVATSGGATSGGASSGGATSAATLLEGAGLMPARQAVRPEVDPAAGILARYDARRFAAAGRFALDPGRAGSVSGGPTISILLPVYRTPLHVLERAILSVMCQTYKDWELCVVDDHSGQAGLRAALARFAAADARIRVVQARSNGGIAAASNRALGLATGTYAGLLDHDDMLTGDALELVAAVLRARPELDLVYSDECTIDAEDVPVRLYTKPDWSPMLLTAGMYTGHFSVYRTAMMRDAGGFRSAFDYSQDYDLALRIAERGPVVAHIREVLYGWRMIAGSAAMGDKPSARASNVAALQSALERRGWGGAALPLPMSNRMARSPARPPLVSIVVPSDTAAHILQTVMSIVAHTAYPKYEIVVVARDVVIGACRKAVRPGRVRFVGYNEAFNFSDKCNAGAAAARGAYVVFFNDDVRVVTPDWIEILLEALTLPGVGAVAPKLLYEDNTIQHAGMVTGTRRLVTTAFHCFPHATPAHHNMAQSLREVSLLSGACLAMPASVFAALGGFDAVNTPIAHSDVDLCLRLREAGLSCLFTPHAVLTHIGHLSMGIDERAAAKRKAFRPDKADIYLMRRFGRMLEDDPFRRPCTSCWRSATRFRSGITRRRGSRAGRRRAGAGRAMRYWCRTI